MSEPVLRLEAITKRFGALLASDAVSLDLRVGEIHALIGPNGAGKSTLIQQIAGGLRPDAGRIAFDGRDVTALDTVARARAGLSRTFQISALPPELTVLQNATLGALGACGGGFGMWRRVMRDTGLRAQAVAALERVGLLDHQGTRTADLSHGQRRQLEVGLALVLRPKAFVMDEPMAGLGTSGSKDLTHLLAGLRDEAPILLVEHDMDAVFALADRISVLVEGRIIATGTAAEIRADATVRRAYLGDAA
ncbi:MAG: branched-chain amino acid transport system ATP-binding protein [Paracoccaceae bacterium]|jgi:branched-chain amino acid transport system ATP-binding protein